MADSVYVGNAGADGAGNAGWLLGHFMPPGVDVRHTTEVEVKWGVHPRGDRRAQWVTGEKRTALLVLVSGRFHVRLRDRTVLLAEQGDYIVWGPGVDHSWWAQEESIVLTVRWPSVPGYAVPLAEFACGVAADRVAPFSGSPDREPGRPPRPAPR